MAWVLSEIFGAINDIPLAPEVVNSVRDALGIDVFLGTGAEVLFLLEAKRFLYASLEHLA